MSIAFSLLLICIVFASGAAIHDGSATHSLIAALAALALAFVAVSARAADVNVAAQVTRRFRLAAAVPAIWMVIQLLPTPFGAHSIWIYANDALNRPSWGHLSVDPGATILALIFYLANLSLIVVSVFVAQDRRRAELILLTLAAITPITTVALLVVKWGAIAGAASDKSNEVLGAVSALGIVLSLASGVRAFERYERRREEKAGPAQDIGLRLLASALGLLVCLGGLAAPANLNVALVATFGVVTFGSLQAIRRANLVGWATGFLVATMMVAAAMIIFWRYDSAHMVSPFLQFATASSADAISVTQRLLSDAGWRGTGAGTYAAVLPLYQNLDSAISSAPSTASAFAIELGWPMTLFAIVTAFALIVVLYRGALMRGRDSFYPAAAAACTVIMLAQAFCDTSLPNSCVAVVGAAVVGLGLAQSVSRRQGP